LAANNNLFLFGWQSRSGKRHLETKTPGVCKHSILKQFSANFSFISKIIALQNE